MPIELTKQNVIDLTKKAEFELSRAGLDGVKSQVKAVIDISGSMGGRFSSGTVQNVISRVLALAIPLDDNGEVDVDLFGTRHYSMPSVKLDQIEGYVKREILSKHGINEGTLYAPPLQAILDSVRGNSAPAKTGFLKNVFGSKPTVTPTSNPLFVLFFTDGDNGDRAETEKIIRELSHYPVFIQFIGLGRESFSFLEKLNDLSGRELDNAGFMKIEDIDAIKDGGNDGLYARLLNEYPDWIKAAKTKGIVI